MVNALYCSFCGKSQYDVEQLIAGPGPFVCDQYVDMLHEIVEEKRDHPDPATRTREIRLKELRQLRADIARLQDGLAKIEQKINGMVEET